MRGLDKLWPFIASVDNGIVAAAGYRVPILLINTSDCRLEVFALAYYNEGHAYKCTRVCNITARTHLLKTMAIAGENERI